MEAIKKGLQIYENFKPTNTKFALSIAAEIDPIQYWRDNPIFLRYIEPYIKDIVEYREKIPDYLEGTSSKFYLDQIEKIRQEYKRYEEKGLQIIEDLKEVTYISDGEPMDLDIPPPENLPTEIHIYDDRGNIIKTIPVDLGHREYKTTDVGLKPISIFDSIPDDFSDDKLPHDIDEVEIKTLNDSYIKDKLWIASRTVKEKIIELDDASKPFQDSLMVIPDNTEMPDENQQEEIINQITEKIDQWYGIPLVSLSPNGTPLNNAFILQVDTRKDWTLNLTNLGESGTETNDIRIDKTIPPGKRFSAGLSYTYPAITIYLKIDGDDTLYTHTTNLTNQEELRFYAVGVDPLNEKTLCGTVYDIKYWGGGTTPIVEPRPPLPYYPPDGWIYSGQPGWHDGDKFIPIGNEKKPAWKNGDWWLTDDGWAFIHNGYLDRFFCRYNLLDTDFTITWYQYHIGYPQGIKTFIADHIHSNYIRYDFDNHQFIIDINGVHYTEYITLPEFLWAQMTLRYYMEDNQIEFQFRDFFHDRIESIRIDIGPEFEFELISMFARFDKETNQYIEVLEGVCGFIMIHPFIQNDNELNKIYQDHKSFLINHDPRYIESI